MKSYKTDINNRILFSKDMAVVELIDASKELLSIFLRLDIQLPFGDISVEQMCRRYDMSPDMFLMLCRVYAGQEFELQAENLHKEDLTHILRYLRASHHHYTECLLPSIERGVERVMGMCDAKQSAIVRKFYNDYAAEVQAHLEYEEQVIFPYVESVLRGDTEAQSMAQSMAAHTDICDKVDDIKSIIIKYLPESCPTAERYDLLCDLFSLRDDLAKHTLIEVAVLTPMVIAMEKQIGL